MAEQHRFETHRAGVVLLVRVRRRGDHCVDTLWLNARRGIARIARHHRRRDRAVCAECPQVVGHRHHALQPRRDHSRVVAKRTDADLRPETEVAYLGRQYPGERKLLVGCQAWRSLAAQGVAQCQHLVQRQLADRILDEQLGRVGFQALRPEAGRNRRTRLIVQAVTHQASRRLLCHKARVAHKRVWVGRPVRLHLGSEPGHRHRLDAHARDAELLGLDQRRAGTAERVEQHRPWPQAEPLRVVAHKMRRKRQHEAIPVVRRRILREQRIHRAVRRRSRPASHGPDRRPATHARKVTLSTARTTARRGSRHDHLPANAASAERTQGV